MPFIGKKPTAAPLTSSDVADGIITNAKLAQDIISADTDEFLVSDAGVLKRMDYSYIKGGGITVADQWRLTTSFTGAIDPLASNLEQVDGTAQGTLGSAMSVSSGIWTFPSTGFWWVFAQGRVTRTGEELRYNHLGIKATTDNSTYTAIALGTSGMHSDSASNNTYMATSTLLDVTNTTNVKIKFYTAVESSSASWYGSSTENNTFFTFIRLGDT